MRRNRATFSGASTANRSVRESRHARHLTALSDMCKRHGQRKTFSPCSTDRAYAVSAARPNGAVSAVRLAVSRPGSALHECSFPRHRPRRGERTRDARPSVHGGVLSLDEVCRFPNEPVRDNGSLRLGHPSALERDPSAGSIASADRCREHRRRYVGLRLRAARCARPVCVEQPYHYRDVADRRRHGSGLAARVARRDLLDHRHPVSRLQHAVSALRRVSGDARRDRLGRTRSARFPIC